jgi:hypothetical protein
VNTAWQQENEPDQAGRLGRAREPSAGPPGRDGETAHRVAEARPDLTHVGPRQADAETRRAEERAQAARSVDCPCQAGPGMSCGLSGDHLARYLRAEQSGAIKRESLKDVIAGLDVIAPQVLIQPPGERAAYAAGAQTADQVIRAQMDAGMSSDRIEASAESVLGGRFDHPTPASEAFYRGYDEVAATYTREARELEAGA